MKELLGDYNLHEDWLKNSFIEMRKQFQHEIKNKNYESINVPLLTKKLLDVAPSYEQCVAYETSLGKKFTKQEFEARKITEEQLKTALETMNTSFSLIARIAPNYASAIDPEEIVALGRQETLLRSDAKRAELKKANNTDYGYIQLSPSNEVQALKLLGNNTIISDKKTKDPQLYWTTLGITRFLHHKQQLKKPQGRTDAQVKRILYFQHNAGSSELKDIFEDVTNKSPKFSDIEHEMLLRTGDESKESFIVRPGIHISPYYENLLTKNRDNIASIPVLDMTINLKKTKILHLAQVLIGSLPFPTIICGMLIGGGRI